MIKQDRLDLNERFIKVFRLLEAEGKIIKNDRNGRGVGDFAEKITGKKGYGHIIQAFLNPDNKRVISYTQAGELCEQYGVSSNYMFQGQGEPFERYASKHPVSMVADRKIDYGSWRPNIQYSSFEAFAGDSIGAAAVIEDEKDAFMIPGVAGDGNVAFPINGRSMDPVISDGDIVVCRPIRDFQEIKDNEIYAVRHDGSMWVKYVQRVFQNGRIVELKCISANHLEYDPFTVEVDRTTRLYKVIRRISEI